MSDNRLQDLEARTYHIDGRVSAIESQLTSQGATLSRVEQHLLGMSKGKEPNVIGWIGLAVSGFLGVAGLVFSLAKYMDLQLQPIRAGLAANAEVHETLNAFRHQMHYEIGVLTTQKEDTKGEIKLLWNHIHKLEAQDTEHNKEIAHAQTARKAMGDYIRQIDELGSRRWNEEGRPRIPSKVD